VARESAAENVGYETADVAELPYPEGSFDVIVCFEVVEHVDDPGAVLDELTRVLAPDGLLLISSPNRNRTVPGNPNYRHAYAPRELRDALSARFPQVRLVQQHAMLASVVSDGHGPGLLPGAMAWSAARTEPGDELYTLAAAGREIPDLVSCAVTLAGRVELGQWVQHYHQQDELLRGQAQLLEELDAVRASARNAMSMLAVREQQLAEIPALRERARTAERALTSQLESQRAKLTDHADRLRAKLAETRAQLEVSQRVIADVTSSASWRITAPLRRAKRMVRHRSERRRTDELVDTQSAQSTPSRYWHGGRSVQSGRTSGPREESFRCGLIGDAELSDALARLETAAAQRVDAGEFDLALRLIEDQAAEIRRRTLALGLISGSYKLDELCLSIGREIRDVVDHRRDVSPARPRHVYIVSELYREGGHTRLLEDLIAAQPDADHQIIWTWHERFDAIVNIAEILRVRERVPLDVLRGEPEERLRGAFSLLTELCPDVLVHLGHQNDPIAIALMQPGIARRRLIIHHADFGFALGRSLEGAVHVALGRHFQDFAREQWGLETVLLRPTCADPVAAPVVGRAKDRPFLTVTSGSPAKFDLNGESSYLDVLTERFAARDGAHVHIGPLSADQTLRVDQHLDKLGCRDRFVHTQHVPHLASALSELAPSVYIDSYPVGGAKAIIEAMAAGLPICAARHDPNVDSSDFCYPECFWWTHPAEVGWILAALDPPTVERHAALSRTYFERNHSPTIFRRRLQALTR
jgi:hypothetical protein